MSRATYAPVATFTGNGTQNEYSFDFKIEDPSQLLLIEVSGNGVETNRVRGDEISGSWYASIEYDSVNGGGTVTLVDNLTTGYTLYLIQANDAPTQPTQFRGQSSFTLRAFENALDWLGGAVQRISWLAQRSIRLNDTFTATFDMQLPRTMTAEYLIGINEDGDGFDLHEPSGLSLLPQMEFEIVEGQAATDLEDMTFDSNDYSSVVFDYEISRGTMVFSVGRMSLHYRNSTWYLVSWSDNRDSGAQSTGVTFSISGTTIAQLRAEVTSSDGKGDGQIKLKMHKFAV